MVELTCSLIIGIRTAFISGEIDPSQMLTDHQSIILRICGNKRLTRFLDRAMLNVGKLIMVIIDTSFIINKNNLPIDY